MIRRILALTVVAALVCVGTPAFASSIHSFQDKVKADTGTVEGKAQDKDRKPLAGVIARLRNVDTGAIVGSTTTDAAGAFSFAGIASGNFVVEIVDLAGNIIGTSAPIVLGAGGVVTGVVVSATAAGSIAAAAAGGGLAGFFTSTTGLIITAAAVGGGIVGYSAEKNKDKSPHK